MAEKYQHVIDPKTVHVKDSWILAKGRGIYEDVLFAYERFAGDNVEKAKDEIIAQIHDDKVMQCNAMEPDANYVLGLRVKYDSTNPKNVVYLHEGIGMWREIGGVNDGKK